MNFIDSLVRLLLDFIPLRLVRANQQGVIEVFGRYWKTVGPGLYPHVKYVFEVDDYLVVEDGVDCPNQILTTKDNKRVSVSVNVTFRILDAGRMHLTVNDHYRQIGLESMRFVARVIRRFPFAEIHPRQHSFERSIRNALAKKAATWGIEVLEVGLTHLAETRPIHLLNDQSYTHKTSGE